MKVLVVGGGGREHALAWRLAQRPGGRARPRRPGERRDRAGGDVLRRRRGRRRRPARARRTRTRRPHGRRPRGAARRRSRRRARGARGMPVFGPSSEAAPARGLQGVGEGPVRAPRDPGGRAPRAATMARGARVRSTSSGPPYVVKVDGLAAGKGVVITEERDEAVRALEARPRAGRVRRRGVDRRRRGAPERPGGLGVRARRRRDARCRSGSRRTSSASMTTTPDPNTGGMGAYSPVPFVDEAIAERIRTEILEPHRPRAGRGGHPVPRRPVRGSDAHGPRVRGCSSSTAASATRRPRS